MKRSVGLVVGLWALSAAAAWAAPAPATGIAVTVDDLPFVGRLAPGDTRLAATGRIISALERHRVPAIGFVVCARARERLPILRAWLDAGFELGNHSTDHPHRDELGDRAWEADVRGCRDRLATLVGKEPAWFRFPYLQRGKTPARRDASLKILARLGQRVAPVSIDTGEWVFVAPYVAALKAGDAARAREIGQAWVDHVLAAIRHYRQVAQDRLGRDVRHVLLLHANALAADYLDALLAAIAKRDGSPFIDLAAALQDPVYARPDDYAGPVGLSWLYRFAPARAGAWAWDSGQVETARRRFGKRQGARTEYRVDVDLVVRPVAARSWVVTHEVPYPANSLVAEMADGALLLVDTPYTPEATRRLLGWLHARFGTRRGVAINTHFHYDAAGGNRALLDAGWQLHGSTHSVALLAEREEQMRSLLLKWLASQPELAAPFRTLKVAPPARTFEASAGLELRFATDWVRVSFPGPAHAPDNLVVHLPEHGVLFGGCLLLAGDRVGNRADADMQAWPDSVRALLALPADVVIPGHGSRFDRGLIRHTLAVLARDAAGR